MNLFVDKIAVFSQLLLRPGDRIGISDAITQDQLSATERAERGSCVGCVAGALAVSELTHEIGDGVHTAIVRVAKPVPSESHRHES